MRTFDYVLLICGGFVVGEAALIITFNTKRGFWELTNKLHVLSAFFYCMYLAAVVYSSLNCDRSNNYCDKLWKICSTLYIAVTMAVYFFYYVKSRLVHSISWKGKHYSERLAVAMIAGMGVSGIGFFWLPIKGVQYGASLRDGECYLDERPLIAFSWVIGDTLLSLLLLMLFIRPLQNIKSKFRSPRSIEILLSVRRLIQKNRNLLLFTVVCTFVIISTAAIQEFNMRTCIYLCAIDRLVTLQCITMSFSYDKEFFYCHACLLLCLKPIAKIEQYNRSLDTELSARTLQSPDIIEMPSNNPSMAEDANTASYSTSVDFPVANPEDKELTN